MLRAIAPDSPNEFAKPALGVLEAPMPGLLGRMLCTLGHARKIIGVPCDRKGDPGSWST
jgi:hypothetical protein